MTSSYFAEGDGIYVAELGRQRWVFSVRDGVVFFDMTRVCTVEEFPPSVRQDWAQASYSFRP